MKRSLKELLEYKLVTTDEFDIDVKNFLFDEYVWGVRFIQVDLGNIFNENKVLVGRDSLKKPEWNSFKLPLKITKTEIENSPILKDHLPVSRKYEEEVNKYYNIFNYWELAPTAIVSAYPPRPIKVPKKNVDEAKLNTYLRSFNEILGYNIKAIDGEIGCIDDLVIDDQDWQIIYAAIDTRKLIPWSKRVIIPISVMKEISYERKEISVNYKVQTIKNSPVYKGEANLDIDFEKELYNFYLRTL